MSNGLPAAWLGMRDLTTARICSWCTDKSAAEKIANERGYGITHGICDACARKNFDAGTAPTTAEHSQAAPRPARAAVSTPSAAAARVVYLPLPDAAKACGISAHELNLKYFPSHWAVPRDWRWIGKSSTIVVNEAKLPELAESLRAGGQFEAAEKLERWAAEIATPQESHAEFVARHTRPVEPPWFQRGQYA